MRWIGTLVVWLLLAVSASAQTLNAKTGTFNVTTGIAGSTVAVTGVGFTPELILVSLSGRLTAGANAGDHHLGFGAAASATSRWAIGTASQDAAATSDTSFCQRDDAVICTSTVAGTLDGLMDVQSMDADGFTLVIDDAFAADYIATYLALQGDIDVCLGRFTAAGVAPVTQTVDSVTIACLASFTPTAVLFASTREATDPPTASAGAGRLMVGAMTGATAEGVSALTSADGSATASTAAYSFDAEAIAMGTASAVTDRAEFSAFASGSFTINWLERATAARIFVVAIKGVSATVGNLLTQTDTITTIGESGFGFTPKAALVLSSGKAKSTQDTVDADAEMSIGFGATTGEVASAVWDENGPTTMQVARSTIATELYQNFDATEAVVGAMGVQSWDSDGLTLIMSDADPTQAFAWYLALGVTGGGGGGTPCAVGAGIICGGLQ